MKRNNKLPNTVAIIYSDIKREYFPTEEQYITEKDSACEAELIAKYIIKLGVKVILVPGNNVMIQQLKEHKPEMVINLVESVCGFEWLSAYIPAVLDSLNIPYTGANFENISLDYNKFLIKKRLRQNNLPVPRFQLFESADENLNLNFKFPLISKLNEIHGAVEITEKSISEDENQLKSRIKFLIDTYKQPVLVEEFIQGREITAIGVENGSIKVYLAEKIFTQKRGKYQFCRFEDQWESKTGETIFNQKISDPVLENIIKKMFKVCGMRDYGKCDIRMDKLGKYYIIDTNCNPAFGPKELDIAISNILSLYDISFEEILSNLLLTTMNR